MRKSLLRVVALAFVGLGLTAEAQADPVRLTGTISVNQHEGPSYDLSGPEFRLTGASFPAADWGSTGDDFYTYCGRSFVGCYPGDQLQMSGATAGELPLGTSTLTLGGSLYDNVFAFLDGSFAAPSRTVPAFTGELVAFVDAPFTFNGTLRVLGSGDQELLFRTVTGSGTAVARLIWNQGAYSDENQSIRYNFDADAAPVPEPATIILLGSGLAGTLLRARRARRQAA